MGPDPPLITRREGRFPLPLVLSLPPETEVARPSAMAPPRHVSYRAMLECSSASAVAGRLELTWDEVDGIMSRAVSRGLARRGEVKPLRIGIDETSYQNVRRPEPPKTLSADCNRHPPAGSRAEPPPPALLPTRFPEAPSL